MASRTVSVTLTANAAQYITAMDRSARATEQVAIQARAASSQIVAANRANTRAVELAVQQQIAALRSLRLAQRQTVAPVGGPIVGGGGGPAATNAARQALLQQQALGAQMNRDIQRQTQLDNLHSQALAENAARDEAAAQRRAKAQQNVGKASAAAGAVFLAVTAVSIAKAAQFEQAMSHVEAVTDATAGTMKQLGDAAIDAGSRTVFTATESANAIEELAKAGLSTKDILGGGLTGALDLASAGTLGVADAAEITASALVQFNLQGDQAVHVADLLSAGANKAQGSVQDLGVGLSYVGPVAASMGISIEETSGALALLANNGILAEKGGTALRGLLLSLTSPSKKASEEMEALGINVYDAAGNFVGINGAAQQLQDKLGPLTEAQRNYSLGVIFSNAQVTSANVLLKGGARAVDDWTGKVNDQGNAARTAATKLDNLRGDIEKLGGAFDTAFISTGQGGLDPLRGITQGVTGVVNAYNSLSPVAKTTTLAMLAVTGAITVTGGALLLLLPRIIATRAALTTMAPAGSTAARSIGLLGKAAGGLAILSTAAIAIGAFRQSTIRATPGIEAMTASLLKLQTSGSSVDLDNLFTSESFLGNKKIDGFVDALDRLNGKGSLLAANADSISKALSFIGAGSKDGAAGAQEAKASFEQIDTVLTQLVTSGSTDQAASLFDSMAKKAEAAGRPVEFLKKVLPGYEDALIGVDNKQSDVVDSTGEATGALGELGDQMEDTRTAAEKLGTAIDLLNGPNIDVAKSQIDLANGLETVRKAFKENGASISLATEKGRENRSDVIAQIETINNHAQAITTRALATKDEASAVEDGRKAYAGQIRALEEMFPKGSAARAAVHSLVEELGKVPTKKDTALQVYGADETTGKIKSVAAQYKALPESKRTRLSAEDRVTTTVADIRRQLDLLHSKTITIAMNLTGNTSPSAVAAAIGKNSHADGGHITGPGGPRDDMIPAWLSNGEFVVNAAATARNRGLLESINSQKFADGGIAQLSRAASLTGISGQLQTQIKIISNGASTAADIAKAAKEVERLQQLWKDTADAIDQAKQRRELLYAIDKADREAKAAAKTKDKGDDQQAAGAQQEARKALRDFDADAKRSAQGALNDRRAANAAVRAEAAATIEANRQEVEFAGKSKADQLEDLNTRIKGQRKYTEEYMRLTEQRASIQADVDAEAKAAAEAAATAAKAKSDYIFENETSPAEQLRQINERINGETQYSEAWIALANQRRSIQAGIDADAKQAAEDAKQAIETQKQAVEQQADTLSNLLDQQADLTKQLDAAQATYKKAVDGIKAARTEALATVDLTQRQSVTPGTSITNLLRNASASNANFDEWVAALAEARRLGVSEAVIKSLGLDQGPQALGQLRQLNKATDVQVTDLNASVARRQALAATQTDAEEASGVGQVATDIRAAKDELVANQADLNAQLNTLGVDQGRTYAAAIAEGLLSASPAVRAAASALIGGAAGYDQLTGRAAGTTQASGFASGGMVYGPGGPRSDSIPAWLSNGEFVVNAASTAAARPILEAINAGRYADGGFISAGRVPSSSAASIAASAEVNSWSLQMEVRRLGDELRRQTAVIRESGLQGAVQSNTGW